MRLELERVQFDPDVTIGALRIAGEFFCWICEDTVRPAGAPKVKGQTAIPFGTYRVIINHSPRFNRPLPLLENVPGFDGIRIHPGNNAANTEGCLLPGMVREAKGVGKSQVAFDLLFKKIAEELRLGRTVTISIT